MRVQGAVKSRKRSGKELPSIGFLLFQNVAFRPGQGLRVLRFPITTMRCYSVLECHSSSAPFQDRGGPTSMICSGWITSKTRMTSGITGSYVATLLLESSNMTAQGLDGSCRRASNSVMSS
jgi:hypothetical protein